MFQSVISAFITFSLRAFHHDLDIKELFEELCDLRDDLFDAAIFIERKDWLAHFPVAWQL